MVIPPYCIINVSAVVSSDSMDLPLPGSSHPFPRKHPPSIQAVDGSSLGLYRFDGG